MSKPIKQEVLLQAIREHCIVARRSPGETSPPGAATLVRTKPKLTHLTAESPQNCRHKVAAMADALDRVDFETVTFLGHQMKGSGGAFGFQAITDIGAALQEAGESADTAASRKSMGDLSCYLDRVATISD